MKVNTKNTKNREMNEGWTQNHDQTGFHILGNDDNCREQLREIPLQYQEQPVEQKARKGCFRLLYTAHDPAKGDAG